MKKNILLILSIVAFRMMLDWIYLSQISPAFSYSNYFDNSTRQSQIISWCYLLFFIPFVFWINDNRHDILSQLVALFLLFLRIIPFTSVMMFMPQPLNYVIANIIYWLLVLLLLNHMKPQNPFNCLKDVGSSQTMIWLLTIISVFTVVFVSGVYCNFRIHLSLDDVYELRFEAREFNMPIILKYLQSAASNVIPILMIFFISQKKRTIVLLLAFIGLMNFSIAGHKSTLFKILLCLGLFYFPKFDLKKYMPFLFVVLCLLTIGEFAYFNTIGLSTIVIRRGFYVPASLDISYFDYINQYGPTYFSEGIASKIGALSGDEEKRCNNGMFSDAFMNLGYLGCIVFPFIFTYFVKIIEHMALKLDNSLKVFAAFLIVSTLSSAYFTTSMLTHGMFLLALTLYFIPKRGKHFKTSCVSKTTSIRLSI